MEIRFKQPEQERIYLQIGDVVINNELGKGYIVMHTNGKVIAKGFDGLTGYTGHHDSLHEFNKHFNKVVHLREVTIYKKSDYFLQLVRKEGK